MSSIYLKQLWCFIANFLLSSNSSVICSVHWFIHQYDERMRTVPNRISLGSLYIWMLSFILSKIYSFIHYSILPFFFPSISPFFNSSIHPFLYSSIPPIFHSSIHPFVHLSINQFIHQSLSMLQVQQVKDENRPKPSPAWTPLHLDDIIRTVVERGLKEWENWFI